MKLTGKITIRCDGVNCSKTQTLRQCKIYPAMYYVCSVGCEQTLPLKPKDYYRHFVHQAAGGFVGITDSTESSMRAEQLKRRRLNGESLQTRTVCYYVRTDQSERTWLENLSGKSRREIREEAELNLDQACLWVLKDGETILDCYVKVFSISCAITKAAIA